MNASKQNEWMGLVVSIGLAVVLAVGAIMSFGGSSSANDDAYTIEVQTPDQTGTIGTDKGVKRFQTTDARTILHSESSTR
jgi:ABC-type transporter Mla subunit MlaD